GKQGGGGGVGGGGPVSGLPRRDDLVAGAQGRAATLAVRGRSEICPAGGPGVAAGVAEQRQPGVQPRVVGVLPHPPRARGGGPGRGVGRGSAGRVVAGGGGGGGAGVITPHNPPQRGGGRRRGGAARRGARGAPPPRKRAPRAPRP